MRILKKSLRQGKVLVAVENADDLWHLSRIIEAGDLVRGKATRKIKATEKETEKKTLTLEINVIEVDFKDRALRIAGTTVDENEDVPKGSHQSLNIEEDSVVGITKIIWPKYNLDRLQQASEKQQKALILVLDREEAIFALLKSKGYEVLAQLKGKVAKKGVETATSDFYHELSEKLGEYDKRFSPEKIILASPAFWKEDFVGQLDENISKKCVLATCSSVGITAIEEVLKRPELKEVLRQQRASDEARVVDTLMAEIGKDGLAAYGRKEVNDAVNSGNVSIFLITDTFIDKGRHEAEQLLKAAESVKASVMIINSENDAGKKLDSLGGIGAILRYKAY